MSYFKQGMLVKSLTVWCGSQARAHIPSPSSLRISQLCINEVTNNYHGRGMQFVLFLMTQRKRPEKSDSVVFEGLTWCAWQMESIKLRSSTLQGCWEEKSGACQDPKRERAHLSSRKQDAACRQLEEIALIFSSPLPASRLKCTQNAIALWFVKYVSSAYRRPQLGYEEKTIK